MPLLVMVFVMMKQILLNVIMMVDIVAQILTWSVTPYVMMKTNHLGCNYDGGDCCVNVNTDSCSDCNCLASGVITSPGLSWKLCQQP